MKKAGSIERLNIASAPLGASANLDPEIKSMGEVEQFSVDELDRLKIISGSMQNSKILNVFRELRTQLLNTNKKKNFVCMVTSISQGGGTSYVASNLAAVFALDKTKTSLLIDANLYAPSLSKLIIGGGELGITDYLSDSSLDIKDVVYATGIPRLRVIPIGENREAAAEYFSSDKMQNLVTEIRTRYADRYVFIDSPPILDSSEARILSEIVDVVILVVGHGCVTNEQVESATQMIEKDKLAGLVYNN
jgi:exopolysaccharide/PEP-CTERM locus tyrosine autokinase